MLKEGDKAPDFTSKDQDGTTVKLSDLKGQRVVLYFYPKDDTPGCTKEACSFRDADDVFRSKGIRVLGVSTDDEIPGATRTAAPSDADPSLTTKKKKAPAAKAAAPKPAAPARTPAKKRKRTAA